jgi:TonB-linked SusC/RagA family outer membrane protein
MIKNCTPYFLACFVTLISSIGLFAQNVIRGKVSNTEGLGIPGVSVQVKGASNATSTDSSGSFSINIGPNSNFLVFSSVGYKEKEQAITPGRLMQVVLESSSQVMSDVVVVGYGTRRRRETTGAIASVKAEELRQTPNANFAQGLQARVSGVQITQNSAAPGGNVSIRIRGTNSINGTSEPLYVIDGIQFSNSGGPNQVSPLSLINPNDIQSVEVLKDASSTAIYGARGANGVVLITTKRGRTGTTVSYDSYYGVQRESKRLDVLDASQFARLENDVYGRAVYDNPDALGKGTDWQDLVFRRAPIQDHQLSISGGSERTTMALSFGYFDQQGIIRNTGFKRYSLRLNLDHSITPWLKVGTSTYGSVSNNNGVNTAPSNSDNYGTVQAILGATLAAPPTLQPYRDNGSLYPFLDQRNGFYAEVVNPLTYLNETRVDRQNRVLSNVFGEVSFLKNFTYRAAFNVDLGSGLYDFYSPRSNLSQSQLLAGGGSGSKTNSYNQLLMHESILTYKKAWANEHSLTATGVFGTQKERWSFNEINASIFPNDATQNEALQLAANRSVRSGKQEERLDSYMGRLNYGFRDKYYVDLTARVDGSSKFGENNKYGFFPAVAVAWRIIEEPFLQSVDFLSDLKVRASYGITGNAGALGPYQSLATVANNAGDNYFLEGGSFNVGIRPTGIPNPDLRWEKSTQVNFGLDISLLRNRISLVADVYNKRTDDLLFVRRLPLSSGYESMTGNYAQLQNRGVELAFNARILDGDLQWDLGGNFTVNRNKVLSLDGTAQENARTNYSVLRVGEPVGVFRTYVFDGIYQTGEPFIPGSDGRLGGHKVKDVNGDKVITADDRIITGNPNPDFIFGATTSLRWKGFDLSTLITGVQGADVINLMRYALENPLGQRNQLAVMVNRWTPTNPSQQYASGFVNGRLPYSDTFIEDGSFVRIKNITLGYNFRNFSVFKQARLYVSANNLLTITDYSGYDPEVNAFGGSNTILGADNGVYPVAKSWIVGLRVSL